MKIGIVDRKGSFSDKWIEYAQRSGLDYKIVYPYASNVVAQLDDCAGLMWHWHHNWYADQLFARQLALALETSETLVFPSVATAWHFDDKLGQKYLFEAIGCPTVPTYCFYDKAAALRWVEGARFPMVFKLRGGSGSRNVEFVNDAVAAKRLVRRAFGRGFAPSGWRQVVTQKVWELRRDRSGSRLRELLYFLGGAAIGARTKASLFRHREVGYAYFQEFVADNAYDDRFVVIGDRCFALRRHNRHNDFRASGSGLIEYDRTLFPKSGIQLAFWLARTLGSQCLALDVVYDPHGRPMVLEISYGFATGGTYEKCEGYCDANLTWHDRPVTPESFMMDDFVHALRSVSHAGRS